MERIQSLLADSTGKDPKRAGGAQSRRPAWTCKECKTPHHNDLLLKCRICRAKRTEGNRAKG
eukprot:6140675-Lingulodinium_polyedra.AAC.1